MGQPVSVRQDTMIKREDKVVFIILPEARNVRGRACHPVGLFILVEFRIYSIVLYTIIILYYKIG